MHSTLNELAFLRGDLNTWEEIPQPPHPQIKPARLHCSTILFCYFRSSAWHIQTSVTWRHCRAKNGMERKNSPTSHFQTFFFGKEKKWSPRARRTKGWSHYRRLGDQISKGVVNIDTKQPWLEAHSDCSNTCHLSENALPNLKFTPLDVSYNELARSSHMASDQMHGGLFNQVLPKPYGQWSASKEGVASLVPDSDERFPGYVIHLLSARKRGHLWPDLIKCPSILAIISRKQPSDN